MSKKTSEFHTLDENKIFYEKRIRSQRRFFLFLDILGYLFMFFGCGKFFLSTSSYGRIEGVLIFILSVIWILLQPVLKGNSVYRCYNYPVIILDNTRIVPEDGMVYIPNKFWIKFRGRIYYKNNPEDKWLPKLSNDWAQTQTNEEMTLLEPKTEIIIAYEKFKDVPVLK